MNGGTGEEPASPEVALHARYVFPVVTPPLGGAYVIVRDGKVVDIRRTRPAVDRIIELPNGAILPGLVNCHTHLEFSDLTEPLGHPGISFARWVNEVITHRRGQAETGEIRPFETRLRRGLDECHRDGTVLLGDIATSAWPIVSPREGTKVVVFRELLGLDPDRGLELSKLAAEHLATPTAPGFEWGLSPHAPYTVGLDMVGTLARLAFERTVPIAMHLAESPEEVELLSSQSGPLRDLLEQVGAWYPDAIPRDSRPLDYLERLSVARRALVIHGNWLEDDDWRFIASQRQRMSVVYCPRTHAYFGWGDHPFRGMRNRGVRVALGTDSRASNPDLSLFEELRWLARHRTDVCPADLLRMGTLDGAEALGCEAEYGTIAPGKVARLTVIKLPERTAADPHELLWSAESVVSSWPPFP